MNDRATVLDLFCGAAGGWSLGLERAGFRTVAACESDPRRRGKAMGTPCGRWWWVLGTPERRTGGTESGLLPRKMSELMPTPMREEYGSQSYPDDPKRKRPNLKNAVMGALMPTPRATDADRGGRGDLIQAVRGNRNRHFTLPTPRPCSGLRSRGVNQTEIQRALLPTPKASAGGPDPTSHSLNLKAFFATPTRRDWKTGK